MLVPRQDAVGAGVLQAAVGDLQPIQGTRSHFLESGAVADRVRLRRKAEGYVSG